MERNGSEKKDKSILQFIKFLIVGGIGAIIQLVVVNVLYYLLRDWKAALPGMLEGLFNETVMGTGNSNWGYVLPFFLSNLASNTYQYFQNKKTTFKATAPRWCFVAYIIVLVILILVATWVQGILNNLLTKTGIKTLSALAPTIAVIFAGLVYTIVLFPLEKFVLFRKR